MRGRTYRLVEWVPSPEQVADHPDWSSQRERPTFLIVGASIGGWADATAGEAVSPPAPSG